jgi:hypothetical protein
MKEKANMNNLIKTLKALLLSVTLKMCLSQRRK